MMGLTWFRLRIISEFMTLRVSYRRYGATRVIANDSQFRQAA